MVKIAVAGGTGSVASEVIEGLLARNKHQLVILTRSDKPSNVITHPDVSYVKVDYGDRASLVKALRGVHTVLSFIVVHLDPESASQKSLIDAAIEAGVKRFAPSEWGSNKVKEIPFYAEKETVREYLRQLNQEKKVIEHCLFQCGLFLNYLAFPYKTAKHFDPLPLQWDFQNCRGIVLEGREHLDGLTLTKVQDLANVVAEAVDFEGEWPTVGGIRGNQVTIEQILALGEKIRGKKFALESVRLEDVEAGTFETSWVPELNHPSIPKEMVPIFSKNTLKDGLIGLSKGVYTLPSDEWNQLLLSYKFTSIEEFLTEVWAGKP